MLLLLARPFHCERAFEAVVHRRVELLAPCGAILDANAEYARPVLKPHLRRDGQHPVRWQREDRDRIGIVRDDGRAFGEPERPRVDGLLAAEALGAADDLRGERAVAGDLDVVVVESDFEALVRVVEDAVGGGPRENTMSKNTSIS